MRGPKPTKKEGSRGPLALLASMATGAFRSKPRVSEPAPEKVSSEQAGAFEASTPRTGRDNIGESLGQLGAGTAGEPAVPDYLRASDRRGTDESRDQSDVSFRTEEPAVPDFLRAPGLDSQPRFPPDSELFIQPVRPAETLRPDTPSEVLRRTGWPSSQRFGRSELGMPGVEQTPLRMPDQFEWRTPDHASLATAEPAPPSPVNSTPELVQELIPSVEQSPSEAEALATEAVLDVVEGPAVEATTAEPVSPGAAESYGSPELVQELIPSLEQSPTEQAEAEELATEVVLDVVESPDVEAATPAEATNGHLATVQAGAPDGEVSESPSPLATTVPVDEVSEEWTPTSEPDELSEAENAGQTEQAIVAPLAEVAVVELESASEADAVEPFDNQYLAIVETLCSPADEDEVDDEAAAEPALEVSPTTPPAVTAVPEPRKRFIADPRIFRRLGLFVVLAAATMAVLTYAGIHLETAVEYAFAHALDFGSKDAVLFKAWLLCIAIVFLPIRQVISSTVSGLLKR